VGIVRRASGKRWYLTWALNDTKGPRGRMQQSMCKDPEAGQSIEEHKVGKRIK
jgi:hypothetical protein